MENERYRIHLDSMLRVRELGYNMGDEDLWIDLPNIEGLDEAVILVNKAASMELEAREESFLDNFCASQYNKLLQAMNSTNKSAVRKVMKETAEFYKNRKSALMNKEKKR